MENSSKKLLVMVLRSLRKERISDAFCIMKHQSTNIYFEKRNKKRRAVRTILGALLKNKKWAFDRLATSRVISVRKLRLKNFVGLLQNLRKNSLNEGLWKLRKNMMINRK